MPAGARPFHKPKKAAPLSRRDNEGNTNGKDPLLHALNYALKPDSPDYAIIALCNYVASVD